MEVTETVQNPVKHFEEAVWRNQYLETARGHYLTALEVLSGGNQDNVLTEVQASLPDQQGKPMTFAKMDVQMQGHNGVLQPSEKDLQAVKLQLNKALARNTKSQITEMVCNMGSLDKEVDIDDASCRIYTRKVSSDSKKVNEALPKTVGESSSIHKMVESLKAELESLKKEHADLKDVDAGAEFSGRKLHIRLHKSNLENEGFMVRRDKTKQTSEEVIRDEDETKELKVKVKCSKREHDASNFSAKVAKRQRTAFDVEKETEGSVREAGQAKSFPVGSYPTYVSTSESTARIINSEDEHESSSQQVGKPAMLERVDCPATMRKVDGDKCDDTSEFSIRDFVFAARNKNITLNWPFSQKNLQLCLKHGVKDVLPPFQTIDSLRESSIKRCLAEKIFRSEESNHDGNSSMLKNYLGPSAIQEVDHSSNQDRGEDFRDSHSSRTERERDLACKTLVSPNSQSEVESVSTSNLPLSEVSDEQEAAASATGTNDKAKSSASQLSNKKCKVVVRMRLNSKRNTPEDITSSCTLPPEIISSKVCPVCEIFSSSSNTTLNAHIDQCLSSQPPPTWVKSSKLSKPRIKPRKMRLMTDICATAPCCTLEDLDRRNGTNWATNVDFPLDEADMPSEGTAPRVSNRYIINSVDDGSVYIDSSGTKIRILSKLNDTPPLSFSKASEDRKLKKLSKKGKRSKFFSSNRKKSLAKHLKYLKVARQKKRFSSMKVKDCGTGETFHEGEGKLKKPEQPASVVKELKAQGQNQPRSGTKNQWISFKISNRLKNHDSEAITKISGCKVTAAKDSLIGNDQVGSAQVGPGRATKHLNSPVRSVSCVQNNFRTSIYPLGADKSSKISSGGKSLRGPLLRSAVRRIKEACKVTLKLGAANYDKGNAKESSNSTSVPVPFLENEVDVLPETFQNADMSFPASKKLLRGCHVGSSEEMRSRNSKRDTLAPNNSHAHVSHSDTDQMGLASCDYSGVKETGCCSAEASQQPDTMKDLPMCHRITDSLDRINLGKLRQKQGLENGHYGLKDTKHRAAGDTHGNNDGVRSTMKGLRSDTEFIDHVSSSTLGIGVHEVELENVADVSPQTKLLQCSNKFQGPLYRGADAGSNSKHGQSDEPDMLYGNVAEAENISLRMGDYFLNCCSGSFLAEVDPIPIPGPPGSDLPSFSDMGSEDHQSSQSGNVTQPSGDGDDDMSESPLSATSIMSNLGRKDNFSLNVQKSSSVSLPVPDNVYTGWLDTNHSGPLPGITTISSQFTATNREVVTNFCVNSLEKGVINPGGSSAGINHDNLQCCSHQEGIIWMNSRDSHLVGQRPTTSESSGLNHTYSTLNGHPVVPGDRLVEFSSRSYHKSESSLETNRDTDDPLLRTSVYDSCPSAPILRLMGKDLMVSNSMETDLSRSPTIINLNVNRVVHPVSEMPSRVQTWEPPPAQYPASMGALLHAEDQHFLSGHHFGSEQLNVVHSSGIHNQTSDGMYVNERMHVGFSSSLGTPPLE